VASYHLASTTAQHPESRKEPRGIANRVSRLATAAEALAVTPEKSALKVAFIGAAQDLVGQISDDAARVQGLRADVDKEIAQTVDAINGDVRALYELNAQIARSQTSTELLDRRDRLLQGLAEKIPISVSSHENGTVAIYTSGGQALLEYSPSRLDYEPAAQVSATTMFGSIRLFRRARSIRSPAHRWQVLRARFSSRPVCGPC
jgi:flagellar hook-associated protein 1 FlgK